MATRHLELKLPDGRALEVLTDGPASGLPLIFHLGTPNAALLFRPRVEEATQRKLRTVVSSRPGSATSTAKHAEVVKSRTWERPQRELRQSNVCSSCEEKPLSF